MFACVWERTGEVLLDEKDKMSREREGGTEPGLSRKESLSVLGSVIRDQCGR